MVGLLVLLFLGLPIAELFVIIQVGHVLGLIDTLALLVVISVAGAWLVKREGLSVLRRARAQLDAGFVPGRELVDGSLILLAGALMLTPGFITDAVGLLLLLPPVRTGTRRLLKAVLVRRVIVTTAYDH